MCSKNPFNINSNPFDDSLDSLHTTNEPLPFGECMRAIHSITRSVYFLFFFLFRCIVFVFSACPSCFILYFSRTHLNLTLPLPHCPIAIFPISMSKSSLAAPIFFRHSIHCSSFSPPAKSAQMTHRTMCLDGIG